MTELAVKMADFNQPTADDIAAARDAARSLSRLHPLSPMVRIRVEPKEQEPVGEPIDLPLNIFKIIIDLLVQIGDGHAIQLVPQQAELTTQQAADLLNVSRPHLIKLLERDEIGHRMVGTHRKVLASDVLRYREKMTANRREVLARMTEEDQAAGLYDDERVMPREP
jgi:excisionase family DNA binding protein